MSNNNIIQVTSISQLQNSINVLSTINSSTLITILLKTDIYSINQPIFINISNLFKLIIDGNGSTINGQNLSRIFKINLINNVTPDITIKNFILTNGITVNDMIDSTGESVLHKILINYNLTSRDKIELFRFFKDKNLLKMSYNSQQLTPLHLAVKNQIPEIVKILLEAGHDPNNLDVNNKSPLFTR